MAALADPVEVQLEGEAAPVGWSCTPVQRRFVLLAAILASALGFIDGSVVAIATPAIRADLAASLPEAQWVSNAYALTLSALLLVGGAAGDNFGLRRVFIIGIAVFVLASVMCAAAPGVSWLIAARSIQGVGAAIMVPCSLAIIAKAFPRAERGRAIGIWAASSALMTAFGPVLGGLVISLLGEAAWRLIFAINLPLGAVAIHSLVAKVPPDVATKRRRIDVVGAGLATACLGTIAIGLTVISAEAVSVAGGLWFALAGMVFAAIFVVWETRHSQPMIDMSLFRSVAFSGANVVTFLVYFALAAVLFYLPMLLIAGWGLSEAESGFIFVPLSAAIALLSQPMGVLADRIGARLPIAAGSLLVAAAFAGLALTTGSGHHAFWLGIFPMMTLMGLGMALIVSPLSTAIMTAVADHQTGAASGINNAVSRVAGLFAVAAMGGIASMGYASVAGPELGPAFPGFGDPSYVTLPDAAEALRVAANDAGFSALAWVTSALCLAAAIVSWVTIAGKGGEVR